LNDWRWPGPIDGADPVIRWLQQRLREQQLYRGPVDGLVGPEMERALRRFAARRGLELPVNSPVIELLISQLLGPPDLPLLSPRPAAG
jgi:peptidoglycan hydrolase-like protein with peptidoglycan-binding domain